jgi:hypothetical protein
MGLSSAPHVRPFQLQMSGESAGVQSILTEIRPLEKHIGNLQLVYFGFRNRAVEKGNAGQVEYTMQYDTIRICRPHLCTRNIGMESCAEDNEEDKLVVTYRCSHCPYVLGQDQELGLKRALRSR